MILKASIVGMLVVLVIVVYLSYEQDGFVGEMVANQASNPASPASPARSPAAAASPASPAGSPAASAAAYQPAAPAAAAAPAAPAAQPQRNNIRPQVSLSDASQQAMHMKQQSDFLKDLQTVIRNELRLARATDSSAVASTSETSDSCGDSAALSQGKEYASNMIKKDSIPCWGCSLDY